MFLSPLCKWEVWISGIKLLDEVLAAAKNTGEMTSTKAISRLIPCITLGQALPIYFMPLIYPPGWITFSLFIGQNNWVIYNKYQQNKHRHLLKLVIYKTVNGFRFLTCPCTIPLVFQTSGEKNHWLHFPGLILLTQNTNNTQ